MDTDELLIKADIKTLSVASKEEQNILRKIAIEPNDKAHREAMDQIRGTQLVTKDNLENRKSLNLSRTEMIAELNGQIAGAVKRVRSCTNGYYHDLYQKFEGELFTEIKPRVEKLAALRLLAGMHPAPELLPDNSAIDSLAAEIRKTISAAYGI